ncbi:MAG: hypothetical protein P1Q69_10910 [Candidatus Thorarchaeota archaeon]|nr:hypothetical protein [Candidatus Thorarchaeota archaeon]
MMVDEVIWYPGLIEVPVILLASLLYLLPGFLFASIIYNGKGRLKILVVGYGISTSYYILVGFVLSSQRVLTDSAVLLIWLVTISILLVAMGKALRNAIGTMVSFSKQNQNELAILLLGCVFVFFSYFVWEGKVVGISAWDRSEHLVKLLYLDYHSMLPVTEIGMDSNAFYPEGFNLNAFVFSSIARFILPSLTFEITLVSYFAVNSAFLVPCVYYVAKGLTKDSRLAVASVLCYLPISYLLVFESMPSSLAMILVAPVLLAELQKTSLKGEYIINSLFMIAVFLIHLVIFVYVVLAIWGSALAREGSIFTIFKGVSYRTIWVISTASIGLILILATAPTLFWGTLAFAIEGGPSSGSVVSVDVAFGVLYSFLPMKWDGLIFLLYTSLPVLPAFALGLVESVKKKQRSLLGLLFASVYLSVTEITRFNNRIRFFMLFPFSILAGIGLVKLIEILKTKGSEAKISQIHTVRITSFILFLILSSATVVTVANSTLGYGNTGLNWNIAYRTQSYITQEEYELIDWFRTNGFDNVGTLATSLDGVFYQIVESMTDNKIMMGSTWTSPQSFVDMRAFFNQSTPQESIFAIVEHYNISGYIIHLGIDIYARDSSILLAFPNSQIYNATANYRFVILAR